MARKVTYNYWDHKCCPRSEDHQEAGRVERIARNRSSRDISRDEIEQVESWLMDITFEYRIPMGERKADWDRTIHVAHHVRKLREAMDRYEKWRGKSKGSESGELTEIEHRVRMIGNWVNHWRQGPQACCK